MRVIKDEYISPDFAKDVMMAITGSMMSSTGGIPGTLNVLKPDSPFFNVLDQQIEDCTPILKGDVSLNAHNQHQ